MHRIFVGGVHGVGKTTLCAQLGAMVHVCTASSLIRSGKQSAILQKDKKVKNVDDNQQLLIEAFNQLLTTISAKTIVLDGHFVLRNTAGAFEKISPNVFQRLGMQRLVVLTDDPLLISRRLMARDGTMPSISDIAEMQEEEVNQARIVSTELNIPLCVMTVAQAKANGSNWINADL